MRKDIICFRLTSIGDKHMEYCMDMARVDISRSDT